MDASRDVQEQTLKELTLDIPIDISLDEIAAKRRRTSYLRARDWEFGLELLSWFQPDSDLSSVARQSIEDRERTFSYSDLQQLDVTGSLESSLQLAEAILGHEFPWTVDYRGPDETNRRSDASFVATIDVPGLCAAGSGWTACSAVLDALFVVLEAGHPDTISRVPEGNRISNGDFETTAPWAEITEEQGR